jgi:hypothetical protein
MFGQEGFPSSVPVSRIPTHNVMHSSVLMSGVCGLPERFPRRPKCFGSSERFHPSSIATAARRDTSPAYRSPRMYHDFLSFDRFVPAVPFSILIQSCTEPVSSGGGWNDNLQCVELPDIVWKRLKAAASGFLIIHLG